MTMMKTVAAEVAEEVEDDNAASLEPVTRTSKKSTYDDVEPVTSDDTVAASEELVNKMRRWSRDELQKLASPFSQTSRIRLCRVAGRSSS